MEMLTYTTADGADCYVNPLRVTLVVDRGDAGCRIHLGSPDHFIDVQAAAKKVAAAVEEGCGPTGSSDPTLNLLS